MPIISQDLLLSSTAGSDFPSISKNEDNDNIEGDSEVRARLMSVNNGHDELFLPTNNHSAVANKKGLMHYLQQIVFWRHKDMSPDVRELNSILSEGKVLRQDLQTVADQLQQRTEPQPPAFTVKTKAGLLMGTVLVLAGSGVGLYLRQRPINENNTKSSPHNSANNAQAITEYTDINNHFSHSTITDIEDNKQHLKLAKLTERKHANNIHHKAYSPYLSHSRSDTVSRSKNGNSSRKSRQMRVDTVSEGGIVFKKTENNRHIIPLATSLDKIKPETISKINSYQDNDRTIQRCRNRIIGYLHAYTDMPSRPENKHIARAMLSLIAKSSFHEAALARIYLYGTGLFGEKKDEMLSREVQQRLVGDLLSKLLYNKSLDEYLIDVFLKARYISIKDFAWKLLTDTFPFSGDELIAEMNLFHTRYLMPVMPILALTLSDYSNVLVGSITWFLIYLSADTVWANLIKYDERDAIMHGIDVLSYFVEGKLSLESKEKIKMGLKFCAIYFDPTANPEIKTDFKLLWQTFQQALVNRVELSTEIVAKIGTVIKGIKAIGDKPWDSRYDFTNFLLKKYCGTANPHLFLLNNNVATSISKRMFIELDGEQAWCVLIKSAQKRKYLIKIPTLKYKYNRLANDALNTVNNANKIFLQSVLVPSDYFNPHLKYDDFSFIDKSALMVILVQLTKSRFPKEQLIGPTLTSIQPKEKYIFFKAACQGEERIYAIDKYHKQLVRRVNINFNDLKGSLEFYYDEWPHYPNELLQVSCYKDAKTNITISESEGTALFIDKIAEYQDKNKRMIIDKNNANFMTLDETIFNVMKELFIPFYSCITALQKEDATDIFSSCLLDGVFIFIPTAGKIIGTAGRFSNRLININFMVASNKSFRKNGHIIWRKVINDAHVYNAVLNEQSILRHSVVDLLLGGVDPGIGALSDLMKVTKNVALIILKGDLIRLPFIMLRQFSTIAEISALTKSVVDSSKKVIFKISKPSGRLTAFHHHEDNKNVTFSRSLYGTAYQLGDYYAYYSNRFEVEILLAASDDITEDGENVYVTLSEDEFKGVIFRCVFEQAMPDGYNIVPWSPISANAKALIVSKVIYRADGYEMIFNRDLKVPFQQIIYYPDHQCILSENGFSADKLFDIFKINNVHYVFDSELQHLRPLYDGDATEIVKRDYDEPYHKIKKDDKGNLVIKQTLSLSSSVSTVFNTKYSLSKYFSIFHDPITVDRTALYSLPNKLVLNTHGQFFELNPGSIKNQFTINDRRQQFPSFIIGWDSMEKKFIPSAPYLKKSSSNIGSALEYIVGKSCIAGEKIDKFPTLLLSGAVSANFDLKLRIFHSYYSLGQPIGDLFSLKCSDSSSEMVLQVYYDLLTSSYELANSDKQNRLLTSDYLSPYDEFLNQYFSVEKFPDMQEIINLSHHQYNEYFTMQMRQAGFLKRLNPIDRMETLQQPLVQIYSWELHRDVQSLQRKYPIIALWMTWQRQLNQLFKSQSSTKLSRIRKMRLQNTDNNKSIYYNAGALISHKFTDREAIWISNNEEEQALVFQTSNNTFYTEVLDSEDPNEGVVEWMPKAKNCLPLSVTQFMYEKNAHPRITIDKKNQEVILRNSFFDRIKLERHNKRFTIEHFFISPNGKWLVSIDSESYLLVYDLYQEKLKHGEKSEVVILPTKEIKLVNCTPDSYDLFVLSDEGVLYCPKDNLWLEINGDKTLWAAPVHYFPAFISSDQRFLGFKYQGNFDILLYDQKRKLATLLKQPSTQDHYKNVTAVAFSAMNALIALSFDTGFIYLYDLVRDRKETALNPLAHIQLDNIINDRVYDNIMMRFEGVFDSLTIIHPEGILNSYHQIVDVVYMRSSYSFLESDFAE